MGSRHGGGQTDANIDGVLVVDKPVGPTSHDIVACARRSLGTSRIGHTGTLDPNASGVLPLVLGRATRLAQFLSGREKEYLATIRFGRTTDTYDATGTVLTDDGRVPARVDVEQALATFRGTFEQMPPQHSAKKVGGVRAYKRARADAPIALEPVIVTVMQLELVGMDEAVARLRVECSAGFYVRSLAHDLGRALGTGAVLDGLTRTRSGAFSLDRAVGLAVLTERRDEALAAVHPLDTLLPELPGVRLTAEGARRARHGQALGPADWTEGSPPLGGLAAITSSIRLVDPEGHLVGLARPNAVTGSLHPSVILG